MTHLLLRWTGLLALAALLGPLAHAAEFDCHVILDNNAVHIARVEAPDRGRAGVLASHVRVKAQGKPIGVKHVRECALRNAERLSDPAVEAQRKSKPL
jgi:hypothetical protein